MCKRTVSILLVLVTLCMLWSIPSAAYSEEIVDRSAIIRVGSVNVREAPSEESNRIGGLTLGKEVFVYARTLVNGAYWLRIEYQNQVGFILGTAAYLVWDIGMANEASVGVLVSPKLNNPSITLVTLKRGEGVSILSKTVENDGSEWYQVYVNGLTGYVLTQKLTLMKLPSRSDKAKYKRDVTLQTIGYNVPKGYTLAVDEQKIVSDGAEKTSVYTWVGQMTSDYPVTIAVYDNWGNMKAETRVVVPVDNGLFAKMLSVFSFIFGGFRWPKQIVEIA